MSILQFMTDSPTLSVVVLILVFLFVEGVVKHFANVAIAFAPKRRCVCEDDADDDAMEASDESTQVSP